MTYWYSILELSTISYVFNLTNLLQVFARVHC